MSIIVVLIVGLFIGAVAKLIMPGNDRGGLLITSLLGMAGSVVAYLVGSSFGWYRAEHTSPGLIASVLGALIVLAVYRATRTRA